MSVHISNLPECMAAELQNMAAEIRPYFDRLWPITRSLTGEGVRQTHEILSEILPLERIEIPSGTQVFDWTIPREWKIREAYIMTPAGKRICDMNVHNLHIMNYSVGFRGKMQLEQLQEHLYSLPDQPNAIPYVTSYYNERWGFCITHDQRMTLTEGEYEVVIDAEHFDGSLTLSECVLPGATPEEVLISTYTCHPSMANNELSGPLVAAFLYKCLAKLENRRLTYRFVFHPETIGAVAYLHLRGTLLSHRCVAGYVVTCVGDPAGFTLKKSRRGDTIADKAAVHVLSNWKGERKDA